MKTQEQIEGAIALVLTSSQVLKEAGSTGVEFMAALSAWSALCWVLDSEDGGSTFAGLLAELKAGE